MAQQRSLSHAVETSTLSDVLERVLDKGIVIAGDIRVKLVDIELLSIQLRLVICSVDKAKEMGMDWWVNNPIFRRDGDREMLASSLASIEERMARLEASLTKEETVDGPPAGERLPAKIVRGSDEENAHRQTASPRAVAAGADSRG